MNGCNQLSADNFDPTATGWDHSSCYYILKVLGTCLLFKDPEMEDKSFTLSFSEEAKNWVFFHDFIPDFYLHTRENLYNIKDQDMYVHNEGLYGKYYTDDIKSFFIDVVFRADEELTLETVNWVSSVLEDKKDLSPIGDEWNTLTHISVWNSQQHTGRIALKDVFADLQYETSRNLNGKWSFNDFRNVVTTRGTQFIKDLFNDYSLDPTMVSDKVWYEKELLQDKYMIVRFEFDNSQQKQLLLHETSIQAIKANR
jgi:hypothetical protein